MSDNINDVLLRTIDAIKNKSKKFHKNQGEDKFLLTDFRTLEFYNGELCVLSSKRGMGKTAFALSLLKQLAVDKKQPVGFVTPGCYPDEYFGQRLTAICSGVDAIKVCTGIINASEFTKIEDCLATELAVPIILVIDLPETDTDNLSEPGLYDFKKYMIIPTIASKVIFIYRDRLDRSKENSKPAKLIIAKNEYGAANEAFIKFDNRICLFFEERN